MVKYSNLYIPYDIHIYAWYFTDNIQPIELPLKSENRKFEGYTVTISGWGKDSDDSEGISSILRHVKTTIISNPTCFLSFPFLISNTHICTSGKNGKSACNVSELLIISTKTRNNKI